MNVVVLTKLVPDLVEELVLDEQGVGLDPMWLRLKLNEPDDHAIEQAMVLKEHYGAQVTVLAPDMEGVDDVLFAASARGADRLLKLCGDFDQNLDNHSLALTLANVWRSDLPDLILTGVQAHNDLDGAVGPLLAGYLALPYVGYVAAVSMNDGILLVRKEYPGGLAAEMEVTTPVVLGIQSSERPPGYIAFSKIRQAMRTAVVEELIAPEPPHRNGRSRRMFKPEGSAQAVMLTGDTNQVVARLVQLFREKGVF